MSALSTNQLYDLNTVLTQALAAYGWNIRSEKDAEKLNDTVHEIADRFFPVAKRQTEPNPCIHNPSRCNGGGYNGCACGPYPRGGGR